MNAKRRRDLSRRLIDERERLSSALRALETEAQVDVIEAAPEADAPSISISDAEAAEATASMEIEQLREIDAAIARLRDHPDQFGRCAVCGEEIAIERLELIPWAQRCIKHAAPSHAASFRSGTSRA
jgi:RNA polymerase-binding transcription factor DksA